MTLLLSLGVLAVSTLGLGSAASGATQGVDTTVPPVDSDGSETAGATETTVVDVSMYEEALLTVEDVGGDWETDGTEVLEFGPTAEPFAYCPDGLEVTLPVAGTGIFFTAPQSADVNALSDDDVSELVLVFDAPGDVTSWFEAIDSCVGTAWEESSDPVEHVTLERVEVPELGDESRGFRTVYAHSEGPEHDKTSVMVRVGEALVIVEYGNYGLDEPIDQAFFDGLVETAVAKIEANSTTRSTARRREPFAQR